MFRRSEAAWPPSDAAERRFRDLFTTHPEQAHLLLAGVPYDVSVIGRKGARHGPRGIREAFRFLGAHDPDVGTDLSDVKIHDLGDITDLGDDVLAAHRRVQEALRPVFARGKPTVLLGGDHGLTFAHVGALADHVEGHIGIVVIDAHYDLRGYDGQPTSGTPFRRILTELDGRVRGSNIVEIGIRPYANTAALAAYADTRGVHVHTMRDVREHGIEAVTEDALQRAGDGVDHLWLSVDIDGLDQSVARGCSAPGAGGLWFDEAAHVVRAVAAQTRCRGMDLLEVAPELDPTGDTVRTAAQLVAAFVGSAAARMGRTPQSRK